MSDAVQKLIEQAQALVASSNKLHDEFVRLGSMETTAKQSEDAYRQMIARRDELDRREREIAAKDEAVAARHNKLTSDMRGLEEVQARCNQRETEIAAQIAQLDRKHAAIRARETALEEREQAVAASAAQLSKDKQGVEAQRSQLRKQLNSFLSQA